MALTFATSLLYAQEGKTADLVLKNGAIYTADAARSWADAVAIRDGKIIYVGPNRGVQQYVSPATRVIDLQGNAVAGLYGFACASGLERNAIE